MRRTLLACTLALIASAGPAARANYFVNLSQPTVTGSATGTTLAFVAPPGPQNSAGSGAESFLLLFVGQPTTSASGAGSYMVSETFSFGGSTPNAYAETGTFNYTFAVSGATSTLTGFSVTDVQVFNGAAYGFSNPIYTPMAGTTAGSVMVTVTPPNAVPAPPSLALLGLGAAGLRFFRRRRAA